VEKESIALGDMKFDTPSAQDNKNLIAICIPQIASKKSNLKFTKIFFNN